MQQSKKSDLEETPSRASMLECKQRIYDKFRQFQAQIHNVVSVYPQLNLAYSNAYLKLSNVFQEIFQSSSFTTETEQKFNSHLAAVQQELTVLLTSMKSAVSAQKSTTTVMEIRPSDSQMQQTEHSESESSEIERLREKLAVANTKTFKKREKK